MELIKNIGNISSKIFEECARIILSLLIAVILVTITWAVLKTLLELRAIFSKDIHEALQVVMVNALTILALLEVFRTALAYFSEGRVKVTYIIDTVLVVILTEVMVFWFKEIEYQKIIMVIALVLALIIARILAIRFSPARAKEDI
ncbi:MAG: phosphate-starvation-inducible PsiE family protein [Deltaproteobacteria bacterium]|nr:phosphate-starvation-inducible PsiE family protein [Deltaproteobacteria bacterium]